VDPEGIQQLFRRTLQGAYDDDAAWEAVHELRTIGTREIFDMAAEWCESGDPLRRARGADVIAQIGEIDRSSPNSFPAEALSMISKMVENETKMRPLSSAIYVLGHLHQPSAVPLVLRHGTNAHTEVREAVAFALGCYRATLNPFRHWRN
jgi:hypothetical protein